MTWLRRKRRRPRARRRRPSPPSPKGSGKEIQEGREEAGQEDQGQEGQEGREGCRPKGAGQEGGQESRAAKKKQIVGEGDYAATRNFDKDQAGFVEKNKANIPAMGKDAEKALDGPEGDSLRDAEASGGRPLPRHVLDRHK